MNNRELENIFSRIHAYETSIPLGDICGWHGIIYEIFISKSPIFYHEFLPFVKNLYSTSLFQSDFMNIRNIRINNEKKVYTKKLANCPEDRISKKILESIEKDLAIKTFEELIGVFKKEYKLYFREMDQRDYISLWGSLEAYEDIENNIVFYKIADELYRYYIDILNDRKEVADKKDFIVAYFDSQGVDINENLSFSKYGLIEYNKNNFRINNDKDSRTLIYKQDKNNKFLWLNVNKQVIYALESLYDTGKIGRLAFKITHITELIPLMEDLEQGHVFKLNLDKLPQITSLYDHVNYDNKLQVKFDKERLSLIFEELEDDFKLVDEFIKTQVIHMQFILQNDEYVINHLDHEYIYYTLEEYEERKINPMVKGKKIKTFKIDDAHIPLTYKINDIFFIYFILDNYFSNKELLREYFNELIASTQDTST